MSGPAHQRAALGPGAGGALAPWTTDPAAILNQLHRYAAAAGWGVLDATGAFRPGDSHQRHWPTAARRVTFLARCPATEAELAVLHQGATEQLRTRVGADVAVWMPRPAAVLLAPDGRYLLIPFLEAFDEAGFRRFLIGHADL